ncbi:ParB/RepB/Spo0J family partition protein [Hahella sp. CR1]|uniref:ParB/RepB/Spo0J family partition protein n=1 Tax=Hahella sp. CR1 TaxID=2992807 RepID=UPI002442DB59|nr:ParB/RepB/Spo0J family partition protein [Hahella sp. CR1]MDG9666506.1 ParB/RepB/Spo0J family partition protein [Hahella sp. CR1]
MKKRGLGDRGLNALLAGSRTRTNEEEENVKQDGVLKELPVELIQRGQYQPRRDMDPESLEELAQSIRQQGVMQPIVVREIAPNRYEIIAGERRWRATQIAGKDKIPVIIRNVPDEAAIAMALIENIQRENLNPIEEAMALQRLQDEFGLNQSQVAEAVGKSRPAIANLLRLLALHADVKTMLERGDMEMGHARALLPLDEPTQLAAANAIVEKGLSVRQTEALVRKLLQEKENPKEKIKKALDADVRKLQESLAERLGSPVTIDYNSKGKGKLVIKYNSLDELDGILAHIK